MKLFLAIFLLTACVCAVIAGEDDCPPENPPCDPLLCAIPGCAPNSVLKKRDPCDCCESCYTPKKQGENCGDPRFACIDGLRCKNDVCV
ncbi:unnamed protein product [Diabrotica balteata]|uniref:Uncharacterized protein n=1 Tax=Diabrotica balteata TaxID=107213 RepID=A0A9N9SQW8_DIABA|nr:unnamed protein product [Diabrotica balteata]